MTAYFDKIDQDLYDISEFYDQYSEEYLIHQYLRIDEKLVRDTSIALEIIRGMPPVAFDKLSTNMYMKIHECILKNSLTENDDLLKKCENSKDYHNYIRNLSFQLHSFWHGLARLNIGVSDSPKSVIKNLEDDARDFRESLK